MSAIADTTSMPRITLGDFQTIEGRILSGTSSHNSQKALRSDLGTFWSYIRGNLSENHLRGYLSFLASSGYSVRSICRLRSSAIKFINELVLDRVLDRNILALIEAPKVDRYDSPYVALADSDVEAMVAHPDTTTLSGAGARLCFVLGFYLGLRVDEICGLTLRSVQKISSGTYLKIIGKGKKVRTLPVSAEVEAEIRIYMQTAEALTGIPYEDGSFILRTQRETGGKVHPATVERWYRDTTEALGIKQRVTPHSARATVITKALENQAQISDVAAFAGHSSIETTVIYDKRRNEAASRVVSKISYGKKVPGEH